MVGKNFRPLDDPQIPQQAQFRMRVIIQAIEGDYLECVQVGRTGPSPCTPGVDCLKVARPFMLRTSLTSHAGVSFTYTNATTRVADATETQVIIPAYVVGDEIIIGRVYEGTGVAAAQAWIDLNVDGRMWAKEAS
jgi:hypothetical protein